MTADAVREDSAPATVRSDHDPVTIGRLKRVREIASLLLVGCLVMQAFLDISIDNLLSSTLAAATGWAAFAYCLTPNRVVLYPISTLSIIGAALVTGFGGLIFQTAYLNPIVTNLENPVTTFLFGCGATATLIAAHHIYRHSHFCRQAKIKLRENVYRPLQIFVAPRQSELMVMGLIGLAAVINSARFAEGTTIEIGDVTGQFLSAFRPLSVLPLLAIVPRVYGGDATARKWPIGLYFVALILAAAISNARSTFAFATLDVALVGAIFYLNGAWRPTKANRRALITGILIALAVGPMLYRLSGAMLVAREMRAVGGSAQLVQATAAAFMNGSSLEDIEKSLLDITSEYNEAYTPNQFINRTLAIKYVDLIYTAYVRLTPEDIAKARTESWETFLTLFPQPFLNAIGSSVDKSKRAYSSGDFYNTESGRYTELGSYLTGSSFVDAYAIFGLLCWPALGLFAILSFVLKDSLVTGRVSPGETVPIISVVGLISLARWFTNSFANDSFASLPVDLLRSFPQNVLMYVLVFWSVRLIMRALASQPSRMAIAR